MAKVKNPLWSLEAQGRIGQMFRYTERRGIPVVTQRQSSNIRPRPGLIRWSTVIAEAGRLWNRPGSRGPEATYHEYITGIAGDTLWFIGKDVLLEWDESTLLVS